MGKTTLIERLTNDPYGPLLPLGGHGGGPIKDRQDATTRILDLVMAPESVWDRHCAVDDPVYTEVFERPIYVKTSVYDEILQSTTAAIIFVDNNNPNISTEPKEHKSPELLQQVQEQALAIRSTYINRMFALKRLGLTIISYDWSRDPTAQLLVNRLFMEGVICAV
jgi:hypothetical protein